MKHDVLRRGAHELDLRLTPGQVERLTEYARLLRERGAPLGLIGAADAEDALERHVLDSLRAAPYIASGAAIDLGSGAGLPGIPVAVARPDVELILLDSQSRRVAFAEMVCDELGLQNVLPRHGRVEAFRGRAGACLARAFAPLHRSWAAAVPLLEPNGRLFYFAGSGTNVASEVDGLSPAPALVRTVPPPPVLASAGRLVIMTVQ